MRTFLETEPYMKGKNDKYKSQGECNITESGVVDKVTNPQIYNNRRKLFIGCVKCKYLKKNMCKHYAKKKMSLKKQI